MYYFLVNPASKSGHGKEVWSKVEDYLKENGIEYTVYYTKRPGHMQQIVEDICNEHINDEERANIVVMGGDGSFNEAVQGVISFDKVNIGYIPTGSGNDFAKAIGSSQDPVENIKRVVGCKTPLKYDVGRLKYINLSDERTGVGKGAMSATRYFNVSCGIGFDAAVCAEANESGLKSKLNKLGLGKLAYGIIAIRQIFGAKLCDAVLTLDGEEKIEVKDCRFIVGMNTCYEGGGYKFAPKAVPNDGFIDICTVGNISPIGVLFTLPSATKGTHTRKKQIHIYRAKSFEVRTKTPLWVHTDGEVYAKSDAVKISILPGAMNFLWSEN